MTRPQITTAVCLASCIVLTGYLPAAETGKDLVESSGIQGGLIVYLNGNGAVATADLLAGERFRVQGLFADAKRAQAERERIHAEGCGNWVSVKEWPGRSLPYVDNLVNLIVAEDCADLSEGELFRVLAPNGVLLTKKAVAGRDSGFKVSVSQALDGWQKAVKPWPVAMGEWTHWLCGPDSNAVLDDTALDRIPRSLQWEASPLWQKGHQQAPALSAAVSVNGRLFYILDETAPGVDGMPDRWVLIARDAFNGIELWRRPIEKWGTKYWNTRANGNRMDHPYQAMRRLVAVGNDVYVTLGLDAPVSLLDAATGELIRTYAGTEHTYEIAVHNGMLYAARNRSAGRAGAEPDVAIRAIGLDMGESMWESGGYKGLRAITFHKSQFVDSRLTIGDDHVYLVEKNTIVALNLRTGQKAWSVETCRDTWKTIGFDIGQAPTAVYHNGVLFYSQITGRPWKRHTGQTGKDKEAKGGRPVSAHLRTAILFAVDVASGKKLWTRDVCSYNLADPPDVFVNRSLVWALDLETRSLVGLEPATGETKESFQTDLIFSGTHHNCYRNKATSNFFLWGRNKGIDFIGADFKTNHRINWIKPACRYGIIPSNGMIYNFPNQCTCFPTAKLQGLLALACEEPKERSPSGADAVVRGPSFGKAFGPERAAGKGDWPLHRGSPERHGFQSVPASDQMKPRWKADLGGSLTPPVIADGKVFLASRENRKIFCLNEKDGVISWTRLLNSSMDSPPTYYNGRLLYGCQDGVVYCLDSESGELVWSFRAAPEETQHISFGNPESLWPVSGSVLVHDNPSTSSGQAGSGQANVYCVAGKSTFLNSGLFLYRLDVNTGVPIKSKSLVPGTEVDGEMVNAVSSDILLVHDDRLSLRGMTFDMETLEMVFDGWGRVRVPHHYQVNSPSLVAMGGFLENSFFNSSRWMYGQTFGNILVLDHENVYGLDIHQRSGIKSNQHKDYFPGRDQCILFADKRNVLPGPRQTQGGGNNVRIGLWPDKQVASLWRRPIPVRASAMVVGLKHLYLAGTRDKRDPQDPWGHFDGRKGALLLICSKKTGETKAELELASPPVFDGLSVACSKLFVSCKDGSLICFAESEE
jgi:outer membrane protein assembly factor BamB